MLYNFDYIIRNKIKEIKVIIAKIVYNIIYFVNKNIFKTIKICNFSIVLENFFLTVKLTVVRINEKPKKSKMLYSILVFFK